MATRGGDSYRLDPAELARFDAMAQRAREAEVQLWRLAGLVLGARVIDPGCGPGAFLPALAETVGPDGEVIGVDRSVEALASARTVGAPAPVRLVHAPADETEEGKLEQRWREWARTRGNDPGLGRRLPEAVAQAGFVVEAHERRVDASEVVRSPAWTARHTLVEAGFAAAADVARWGTAIDDRLTRFGTLHARLPVHVVVARP
jgi:SAM-dependent methyltransferase